MLELFRLENRRSLVAFWALLRTKRSGSLAPRRRSGERVGERGLVFSQSVRVSGNLHPRSQVFSVVAGSSSTNARRSLTLNSRGRSTSSSDCFLTGSASATWRVRLSRTQVRPPPVAAQTASPRVSQINLWLACGGGRSGPLKKSACGSDVGATASVFGAAACADFWEAAAGSLLRGALGVLNATRVSAPFAGTGGGAGFVSME